MFGKNVPKPQRFIAYDAILLVIILSSSSSFSINNVPLIISSSILQPPSSTTLELQITPQHNRRRFIRQHITIISPLFIPNPHLLSPIVNANAAAETTARKPYAPLEYLLPATRVKLLIDDSLSLAKTLEKNKSFFNDNNNATTFQQLESLLLSPPPFGTTPPSSSPIITKPSSQYLSSYKSTLSSLPPIDKPLGLIVQSGELDQWQRLRRQERNRENANDIRAAFNAYTSALRFGESYALTASKEDKKRLIREYDRLPDVKAVVTSDLDLRDLYRNEVLTLMEDARAELRYQKTRVENSSNGSGGGGGEGGDADWGDLVEILEKAEEACGMWFGFIEEGDVKEALEVVMKERET